MKLIARTNSEKNTLEFVKVNEFAVMDSELFMGEHTPKKIFINWGLIEGDVTIF
jgi:hypothetical protein